MASIKASSRYPSYDCRSSTSSNPSDISSSMEFNPPSNPTRILARAKSTDVVSSKNPQNLGSMVKKFMEKRSKSKSDRNALIIPADFIAQDLKKKGAKGSNLSSLSKKLFQKAGVVGSSGKKSAASSETKALTDVKSNTRTLAMVLRSERELLSQSKEYEAEIRELRRMLEDKNREVEKLKDLCLNQRQEIKALKDAVLFPDETNSQLNELLEKQGSELKQAKLVIPTLQRQVTSLTGQLQSLAEDLAERSLQWEYKCRTQILSENLNDLEMHLKVLPQGHYIVLTSLMWEKTYDELRNTILHCQVKADKFAGRGFCGGHMNSPQSPQYDQEAANSLAVDTFLLSVVQEFSSGDPVTPGGSPDDLFLKDLNPLLTPCNSKAKSKEKRALKTGMHQARFIRVMNVLVGCGGDRGVCSLPSN
ncbi:hypothetical protein ACLOJK_035710 [Asimina triloba]